MSSADKKLADERFKETLICKIEQMPALYDKSNPQFKDVQYKNSLFTAIAADLGCSAVDVQTCWRTLRDAFTTEKRLRDSEFVSRNQSKGNMAGRRLL